MKVWNSISNPSRDYLLAFSRRRPVAKVCLFQETTYLRLLNSLLSLELGTVDLYNRCQNLPTAPVFKKSLENHIDNAQQLRRLIVNNQGIPDYDSTAVSTELCLLARRVGSHLGQTISHVSAIKLCINRESLLRRKYLELLAQAPFKDRAQLNSLLLSTKSNIISLTPLK